MQVKKQFDIYKPEFPHFQIGRYKHYLIPGGIIPFVNNYQLIEIKPEPRIINLKDEKNKTKKKS